MELAKIKYGKHRQHVAIIDVEPQHGGLSVWGADYMSPDEFMELAQTMVRAAQAVPGVVKAWQKQREAIAKAGAEFGVAVEKFRVQE